MGGDDVHAEAVEGATREGRTVGPGLKGVRAPLE